MLQQTRSKSHRRSSYSTGVPPRLTKTELIGKCQPKALNQLSQSNWAGQQLCTRARVYRQICTLYGLKISQSKSFLNESFTILFYTQIYMCLRPQWTGGRGWVRLNHTIACVGVCNPQDNSRRPLGRSSTEGP